MRQQGGRKSSIGTEDATARESGPPRSRRRESFRPFDPALDFGVLSELTGFGLRRAQLLVFSRFTKSVGDKTVTPLRFSMLALIGANPGLRQAQLAEALGLSRPTATATIDYWEGRCCVERRSDPRDRRSNGIHITQEGSAVLSTLQKVVLTHDRELTEHLSDREVKELRRLLEKVYSP